jgi:prepilin-type N-terminal cleavage/methylation domain-containing protein
MLTDRADPRYEGEGGFTLIELVVATSILLIVIGMLLGTLESLMKSEDRSQRLVSNEQNVRFELDQISREIRASNPLVPLVGVATASDYGNQIEMVLGPTGGTQTVVRWTYDTVKEEMERQVMSDTSAGATVLSQSFVLIRVRNIENNVPVFTYYGQQGEDLVAQTLAQSGNSDDVANCAVGVHIHLISDSNPGPVPFSETQDIELRNRIPGEVPCG